MFSGFDNEDFEVFSIPGLEPRMTALKARIRPKLEALGQHFQPFLSAQVGDEIFVHVAKHARRTINPPADTWVAFSTNARGYKQHSHFQIGLWQTHVFVTFGYIYEATGKAAFGSRIAAHADVVAQQVPRDFVWILDHTRPQATPAGEVDAEQIRKYGERLQTVKKAELLVGAKWSRADVTSWSGPSFIERAESALTQLVPIYRLRD